MYVANHQPLQLSPTKLAGIEATRGVAASVVVLYHVARHVDKAAAAPGLTKLFQSGHAGVDLFFVLSGFIILHVHQSDVGQPGRVWHYARRRFSRVLPLYWVALAAGVAIGVAGQHGWPTADEVVWSATLLPSWREPLLGVAWTLQYEAVFYAVFAVLIFSRVAGAMLLASWLGLIAAGMAGAGTAVLPPSVVGGYAVEFFLGMGTALFLSRGWVVAPAWMAVAGGLGLAGIGAMESFGAIDGYGDMARLTYGIPAALAVLGLAAAEQAGRLRVPAWLAALGGASYSIYLFQFVFIGIAWQALRRAGLDVSLSPWAVFAILSATALAGGVLTARWVERPLLALIRPKPRDAVGPA